ncbi:GNAT family N-acetyltransferase [Nannocystaceae bacterium ST9]
MSEPLPLELTTERLRLRSFRFADVDDVLAYAGAPGFGDYVPTPRPYLRSHAEEYLARTRLADWSITCNWALEHEGRVVGGVRFDRQTAHRKAELGWGITPALRGQGLVGEAVRSVIDVGFERLPWLLRVDAHMDARNLASMRVADKLGMTREGLLRSFLVIHDRPIDVVWYSLLRAEWQA